MNRHTLLAVAIASLTLIACGRNDTTATEAEGAQTFIGKAVEKATSEARNELAKGNFELNSTGLPKAEITPQGDLLISGKAVTVNSEQRVLVLDYRKRITAIAEAGIGIGTQGADLAGKAVGEAIKGVLSGDTDQIEKNIEHEAKGIEAEARKLCALLPGLKVAQDKLATSLPAFKPYANMSDSDVADCKVSHFNNNESGEDVGQAVGRAINESSNESSSEGGGMNAAEEAEAASADTAK